ncbi:MAG: hypothetical protein H6Q90_2419 [Deltaproteobacteria bacterium]|nr:hypothetical protein [Deltaproteobacteria bacterium]
MRALLVLWLAACGGLPVATVTTSATAELALGCEVALVAIDDLQFVFDRQRVTVIRGGSVAARTEAPIIDGAHAPWEAATAIVGPDGARWAIGVASGGLWRVTESGQLERVGSRLGIGAGRVVRIDGSASTFVLALADGIVASTDAVHVKRFEGGGVNHVAAARNTIALAREDEVEVFDLAAGTRRTYPVRGARAIVFTDASTAPRLAVVTGRELYVEHGAELRRVSLPEPRALVASGALAWVLTRDGLFVLDHGVLARTAIDVSPTTRVFPADDGAAWVADAGTLTRHAWVPRGGEWEALVRPVFDRSCAACHRPGGVAALDLSTRAAWTLRRHQILRVLHAGQMPPRDHPMADRDRVALIAWLAN